MPSVMTKAASELQPVRTTETNIGENSFLVALIKEIRVR